MAAVHEISRFRAFGGWQLICSHESTSTSTPMRFSVYLPPQVEHGRTPIVTYLAGLTCTEETFALKAGAQRVAAELGLMLVGPDTSPRSLHLPGDSDHWDFGVGASFYVDATQPPWASHYRMFAYVTAELPALVSEAFGGDADRQGIMGHSMGGHGALVCAFKRPHQYRSVSAFAPVAAPSQCPWGEKAFAGYLGDDRSAWASWDATELVQHTQLPYELLVDQGLEDRFLAAGQLLPERFEVACRAHGQPLTLRRHAAYDHSYYFIATFMEDHLRYHAKGLSENNLITRGR